MSNKEELNHYIDELSQRKPLKTLKNHKAYDRARDRKNKKLYEVDVEDELDEESQGIFQGSKSNV